MPITLQALRQQVRQDLDLEAVEPAPSDDQIMRALNRAKNSAVARLEAVDGTIFLKRKFFVVAAGDDLINIPTDCRRLMGVQEISAADVAANYLGAPHLRIPIYNMNDETEKTTRDAPYFMWRSPDHLYFSGPAGAPYDMNLVLTYHCVVPDLTAQDLGESYEFVPEEWTDMIGMQAVLDLLPGVHAGRLKWTMRRDERMGELVASRARAVADHPLRIRRQGEEGVDY